MLIKKPRFRSSMLFRVCFSVCELSYNRAVIEYFTKITAVVDSDLKYDI